MREPVLDWELLQGPVGEQGPGLALEQVQEVALGQQQGPEPVQALEQGQQQGPEPGRAPE